MATQTQLKKWKKKFEKKLGRLIPPLHRRNDEHYEVQFDAEESEWIAISFNLLLQVEWSSRKKFWDHPIISSSKKIT